MTQACAYLSAEDDAAIRETLPWKHTCFGKESEVEALIPATGTWETIATVRTVNGVDAEDMAAFIVKLVNDYIHGQPPLRPIVYGQGKKILPPSRT